MDLQPETVICYCPRCNNELGRFRNSWNAIGKTYFTPVSPILTYPHGFQKTGEPFQTAPNSPVANCYTQDLICRNCEEGSMGLQCVEAPAGHILIRDQFLLRLKNIKLVSESTGLPVEPSVVQTMLLNPDGKKRSTSGTRASTANPKTRRSSMHFPSNGNDPGPRAESTIPPPSVSNNNPDVSRFMKWAQNAIDSQKIDIDRVSSTLTNIEGEMGLFRSFMDEVRHERKESQQFRANYDQEKRAIGKLAVDLKTLGSKVDNLGREEVARGKSGESLRRDIEIIVSDMRKIHEEATQVGEVKLALGRVARQVIALERTAEQTITNTGTGEANKARDAVLEDYQRNKVVEDLKSQIQGFQNRLNMVEQAVRAVANQPPYVQPAQRTSSIHAQAKALPAQRTTPRVEIPVMKPNESTQRTRSSTRSSVFRQAVQNNVPGDQSDSSLKRKHVHLNEDERLVQNDDDQPAPPRKRGQPPHNAATTEKPGPALVESQQRLLSPTPDRLLSPTPDPEPAEIIEISSAYSPTPPPNQEEQISPKQNTEGNRNQPIEMPVLSKSQVPRQDQVQIETISVYSNTTRNGIGARKVPLRGGSPPNYNHLHPTVNGEPIKNGPSNNRPRRMSLRKTSSSSQLATSVRESEGTPRMDEHCRLRAANGILLTRSGQVDGRSLRHKDVAKNDTPLQQPKLPGGPSMTKGRASMPGNSVVPSVQPEEAFLANRIRNTRTFSSGMLPFGETRSADAEKHKCPVCSATYAYAGGLSYHKRNSACYKDGVENPEGARKAMLAAREKLVKETLDREIARRREY